MVHAINDLIGIIELFMKCPCAFFPQFTWGEVAVGFFVISVVLTFFWKGMD